MCSSNSWKPSLITKEAIMISEKLYINYCSIALIALLLFIHTGICSAITYSNTNIKTEIDKAANISNFFNKSAAYEKIVNETATQKTALNNTSRNMFNTSVQKNVLNKINYNNLNHVNRTIRLLKKMLASPVTNQEQRTNIKTSLLPPLQKTAAQLKQQQQAAAEAQQQQDEAEKLNVELDAATPASKITKLQEMLKQTPLSEAIQDVVSATLLELYSPIKNMNNATLNNLEALIKQVIGHASLSSYDKSFAQTTLTKSIANRRNAIKQEQAEKQSATQIATEKTAITKLIKTLVAPANNTKNNFAKRKQALVATMNNNDLITRFKKLKEQLPYQEQSSFDAQIKNIFASSLGGLQSIIPSLSLAALNEFEKFLNSPAIKQTPLLSFAQRNFATATMKLVVTNQKDVLLTKQQQTQELQQQTAEQQAEEKRQQEEKLAAEQQKAEQQKVITSFSNKLKPLAKQPINKKISGLQQIANQTKEPLYSEMKKAFTNEINKLQNAIFQMQNSTLAALEKLLKSPNAQKLLEDSFKMYMLPTMQFFIDQQRTKNQQSAAQQKEQQLNAQEQAALQAAEQKRLADEAAKAKAAQAKLEAAQKAEQTAVTLFNKKITPITQKTNLTQKANMLNNLLTKAPKIMYDGMQSAVEEAIKPLYAASGPNLNLAQAIERLRKTIQSAPPEEGKTFVNENNQATVATNLLLAERTVLDAYRREEAQLAEQAAQKTAEQKAAAAAAQQKQAEQEAYEQRKAQSIAQFRGTIQAIRMLPPSSRIESLKQLMISQQSKEFSSEPAMQEAFYQSIKQVYQDLPKQDFTIIEKMNVFLKLAGQPNVTLLNNVSQKPDIQNMQKEVAQIEATLQQSQAAKKALSFQEQQRMNAYEQFKQQVQNANQPILPFTQRLNGLMSIANNQGVIMNAKTHNYLPEAQTLFASNIGMLLSGLEQMSANDMQAFADFARTLVPLPSPQVLASNASNAEKFREGTALLTPDQKAYVAIDMIKALENQMNKQPDIYQEVIIRQYQPREEDNTFVRGKSGKKVGTFGKAQMIRAKQKTAELTASERTGSPSFSSTPQPTQQTPVSTRSGRSSGRGGTSRIIAPTSISQSSSRNAPTRTGQSREITRTSSSSRGNRR